jgi:hypothetical protein
VLATVHWRRSISKSFGKPDVERNSQQNSQLGRSAGAPSDSRQVWRAALCEDQCDDEAQVVGSSAPPLASRPNDL